MKKHRFVIVLCTCYWGKVARAEKGLQLETTGLVACSLDQSFCCSVLITVYRSVFCMHQNKKKIGGLTVTVYLDASCFSFTIKQTSQ